MSVRSTRGAWIVLAYLAGGSLWVYGVVDREGVAGNVWQIALLYAGHVLVGLVAGRWWVLPLPLLLVQSPSRRATFRRAATSTKGGRSRFS